MGCIVPWCLVCCSHGSLFSRSIPTDDCRDDGRGTRISGSLCPEKITNGASDCICDPVRHLALGYDHAVTFGQISKVLAVPVFSLLLLLYLLSTFTGDILLCFWTSTYVLAFAGILS